jgi:hypothetical protein
VITAAFLTCLGMLAAGLLFEVVRRHRRAAATAPASAASAAPAVADLVSDFEVSRAIGVSVAARGGPAGANYHPLRGGDRLLEVSVLVGRAGRSAMRTHRRHGRPLSHAGDVAFSGDGWVLGQRAGVVVLLSQQDPGRWRVVGGLPWLLSTALNRVPVPEVDLYR